MEMMANKRLQKNIRKMRFIQESLVIVSEGMQLNLIFLNEVVGKIIVWPTEPGEGLLFKEIKLLSCAPLSGPKDH